MTFYAGIGSRETPEDVLRWMRIYGETLAKQGFTLRSGAAPGADTAFEEGCDRVEGPKEIFLPWKGFNGSSSPLYEVSDRAMEISEKVWNNKQHPTREWKYIKRPVKLLMSRNIHQVLGRNLDEPAAFVVCWTKDGCDSWEKRTSKTGGTSHAIDLASTMGIPVFSFKREGDEERFLGFLKEKCLDE